MSDLVALTPAEVGIIKLSVAQRMKELVPDINPATAEYIFNRHIVKSAMRAGVLPKVACEPGAGMTPNGPKNSPAKVTKNPAVKPPPPPETMGAMKNAKVMKLAAALNGVLKQGIGGEEAPTPAAPKVTPAKSWKPKGIKPAVHETIGPVTYKGPIANA